MQDPSCCILYNTARTESCGLWAPITAAAARFAPQTRPLPPARERTPRPRAPARRSCAPRTPPRPSSAPRAPARRARVTHAPAGESGPPGRARFSGAASRPRRRRRSGPARAARRTRRPRAAARPPTAPAWRAARGARRARARQPGLASRAEGDSSEGGGREPEHRRDGTGVMERRVWHAEHAVVGALEEGEQLHHQRAERRAPAAPRGRRHAHAPRAARRARGGAEASLRGGRCQGRALCAAPGSGGGADGRAGGAEAAPKGRAGGT